MKKAKNAILIAAGLQLAALGFWQIKATGGGTVIPFLCLGIGCGMFGHGLGDVLAKAALRKDPALARQIEIVQNDERNLYIGSLAKAKGFDVMTYALAALMVAFALMKVSFQVLLPLVAVYLFIHFYAVYVRIRLEKQY